MILPKISCEALIVQSTPSSSPSCTLTLPSVTLTVHWPAPSMSKAYELFMPAVFDVSARDGSVSKNSCTLSGICGSLSGRARVYAPPPASQRYHRAPMTKVEIGLPGQAGALVEGTILGAYSPGRWKSKHETRAPERIIVGHAGDPELQEAVERAAIVAERANRSRDLSNMPPNELTPHTLGEQAQELAREHEHLTCEVLATRELDELGMGALTAVGRGSRNE